jgi:hypothetical protein
LTGASPPPLSSPRSRISGTTRTGLSTGTTGDGDNDEEADVTGTGDVTWPDVTGPDVTGVMADVPLAAGCCVGSGSSEAALALSRPQPPIFLGPLQAAGGGPDAGILLLPALLVPLLLTVSLVSASVVSSGVT